MIPLSDLSGMFELWGQVEVWDQPNERWVPVGEVRPGRIQGRLQISSGGPGPTTITRYADEEMVVRQRSGRDWASEAASRMGLTRRDIARMTDVELDARALEAVALSRSVPETRAVYRPDPRADWAPDRAAMHERILRGVMDRYRDVPRQRRAMIAGGLPGAGKTTTLADQLDGFMPVNADDMKDELIAAGGVPVVPGAEHMSPLELNPAYHIESAYLSDRLLEMALAEGRNVVIDATMGTPEATATRLGLLREAGYTTRGVFVDVSVEVSMQRTVARYREGMRRWAAGQGYGGRPVPADVIERSRAAGSSSRNRQVFDQLVAEGAFSGGWALYDNAGRAPRLLSSGG